MKHLFLLIFLSFSITFVIAQAGTTISFQDPFGPLTLDYNGIINGKHSYIKADGTGNSVRVMWTGVRWDINYPPTSDILYFSNVNTVMNPPNLTIGNWQIGPNSNSPMTAFSGNGTTNTPLPVELVEFGAIKSGKFIVLNWITASEVNNSGFDIERSIDGRSWKVIGFANGVGNATEVKDYNFMDAQPLAGMNYYRLKQIDFDGKYDYSPIVSIRNIGDEKYDVSPNPFNDALTFTTNSDELDGNIISIFNNQGSKLKEFRSFNGTVDTNDVPPGIYFVKFHSGEYVKLVKL